MGIIFKQSLFNSFISYTGALLGIILTLWLYPNILTPEELGLTRILLSFSLVFVQIAGLGSSNSIIKFFPNFKSDISLSNSFLVLFLLIALLGFSIIGGLFYLFRDFFLSFYIESSSLFVEFYILILPLSFFTLYFNLLTSFVRINFDTVFSSFLQDVLIRVVLILLLILYFLGILSFEQFIFLSIGNYGFQMLLMLIYTLKVITFEFKSPFKVFDNSFIKELLSYSSFSLLGGVSMIILLNVDIIMISSISNLSDTGIYSIAFYMGSIIAIPLKAVTKISFPIISDSFKNNNLENVASIYAKSSLNLTIISCLLYVGIISNLDNLINILPPEYSKAYWVVVLIGAAFLIDMTAGVNGSVLLASKFYKFDLYSTLILLIISITLNYTLIPIYGIIGGAIATTLSIFIFNLSRFIYVFIKLKMQPFSLNTLIVYIISVIILFLNFNFSGLENIYLDIIVRSFLILSIYSFLVVNLKLSKEINDIWDNLLSKLLKPKSH